jgi:hypothetical protein
MLHGSHNAFPIPPDAIAGIDVRTYIAAMAMQAILTNPHFSKDRFDVCSTAVKYADGLIKSLNTGYGKEV